MASDKLNPSTICPYYRSSEGRVLCCEGLAPHSIISNRFTSKARRCAFQERVCCTFEYNKRCPIARAHERRALRRLKG